MKNKTIRKVLRIRKGEYLLAMMENGIMTTHDTDKAFDISTWSLEQLGLIVKSLERVGYRKVAVERVEEKEKKDFLKEADNKINKKRG